MKHKKNLERIVVENIKYLVTKVCSESIPRRKMARNAASRLEMEIKVVVK